MKVKGLTQTTISGGRIAYEDGVVKSTPGSGKFVARETYGYPYERIPALDAMRRLKETPVDRSGKKPSDKSLEETIKKLYNDLEISNQKVEQLTQ